MKSRTIAALLALAAAAALAATAGFAAVSAAPDPAQMALLAGDIPNSKVKGKRLKPGTGYLAVYARDFELSKPYGSSQLVYISSEVQLAAAAKTTVADMANIRKFLRSTQGRQFLANTFAAELGASVAKKDVTIGKLRTPPIGDEAVLVSLTVRTKKEGSFYAAFTWFRVDRALSTLSVLGLRPAGPVSVAKLGAMVVAHAGQQFTPVSTVPPTITGTPGQGQTLTASTGTFSMTPTFTYAWQRCDAAGAACADIVGATTPTYVVAPEDVAATLRVTVTATNRFGAANGQSAQTAVVT
jgi:hypothetical protein